MTTRTTTFNQPLSIGITGGIGSGKSYICQKLQAAGHHVFYCDDVAKRIIRTHPDVMRELRQLVGNEVYDAEGQLVKHVLAAYLCRGTDFAHQVDRIVHPRVAETFNQLKLSLQPAEQQDTVNFEVGADKVIDLDALLQLPTESTLFMECALLFESGFDRLVNKSVLVHVSHETQISRLMARDHIDRQKALSWMALQFTESEKMQRADYIINNE